MGLPKYNSKWVLKTNLPELSNPKIKKLVCIGDSITHGQVSADYTAILRNRLNVSDTPYFVINAGHNSEFAHHVLKRIDEIVAIQPDYITILIGTNDTNNSFSITNWLRAIILDQLTFIPTLKKYQADLTKILEILTTQTKAKIAILSIPPICEDFNHPIENHTLKTVQIIQEIAIHFSIKYIPLHEQLVEKITDLRKKDGISQLKPKYVYKHWQSAIIRTFFQRFILKKSWSQISERIGFYFHVDPLHLNEAAAEFMADLILNFIDNTKY